MVAHLDKEQMIELEIAQAGLVIDLFRIHPGKKEFELYEAQVQKAGRYAYLSFSEWDFIRLATIEHFQEAPQIENEWLEQDTRILNQHSLLSYVWQQKSRPIFEKNEEGTWVLAENFLHADKPMLTVFFAKINPRVYEVCGSNTEKQIVKRFYELLNKEQIPAIVCSNYGWKEYTLLFWGKNVKEADAVLNRLLDQTIADFLLKESVQKESLFARTVTYPALPADYRVNENIDRLAKYKFSLLISRRPGIRCPLLDKEMGEKLQIAAFTLQQRFGEYDLELIFSNAMTLVDYADAVRKLRESNDIDNHKGWLSATATVFRFEAEIKEINGEALTMTEEKPGRDLIQLISKARIEPLNPATNERFVFVFNRIRSHHQDPLLRESVHSLVHFCEAWAEQMCTTGKGEDSDSESICEILPGDVQSNCTILEFALRQRSEGVQQFMFHALPMSFYSRGCINRIIAVCDGIMKETFHFVFPKLKFPGFMVIGFSQQDRFQLIGPIVTAPSLALFRIELWWPIIHETANYIDSTYFHDMFHEYPESYRGVEELQKILPDLITWALPFQFDFTQFYMALAHRLNRITVCEDDSSAVELILVRMSTLYFIKQAVKRHWGAIEKLFAEETCDNADYNKMREILSAVVSEVGAYVNTFENDEGLSDPWRENMREFLTYYRRFSYSIDPKSYHLTSFIESKIIHKVSGIQQALQSFLSDFKKDDNSIVSDGLWHLMLHIYQRHSFVKKSKQPGNTYIRPKHLCDVLANEMRREGWYEHPDWPLQNKLVDFSKGLVAMTAILNNKEVSTWGGGADE